MSTYDLKLQLLQKNQWTFTVKYLTNTDIWFIFTLFHLIEPVGLNLSNINCFKLTLDKNLPCKFYVQKFYVDCFRILS